MAGRRLKLNDEMIDKIAGIIASGNYVKTACDIVGISETTYYDWMQKGKAGKKPYAKLSEAIKKAEAVAEAKRVQTILEASEEQWQAAAWYLERRYPDRWGKKVNVDGNLGVQIVDDIEDDADDADS
jgi:hypothetical protein